MFRKAPVAGVFCFNRRIPVMFRWETVGLMLKQQTIEVTGDAERNWSRDEKQVSFVATARYLCFHGGMHEHGEAAGCPSKMTRLREVTKTSPFTTRRDASAQPLFKAASLSLIIACAKSFPSPLTCLAPHLRNVLQPGLAVNKHQTPLRKPIQRPRKLSLRVARRRPTTTKL